MGLGRDSCVQQNMLASSDDYVLMIKECTCIIVLRAECMCMSYIFL